MKMSLDIIIKRRALGEIRPDFNVYTTSDIFVIFLWVLSALWMILTAFSLDTQSCALD